LLTFSDSFSTEDSDYRIDNEEDDRAFEMKKRKLDEAGGALCVVPVRLGRQWLKIAVLQLQGSIGRLYSLVGNIHPGGARVFTVARWTWRRKRRSRRICVQLI
jgi:hypothetical protein